MKANKQNKSKIRQQKYALDRNCEKKNNLFLKVFLEKQCDSNFQKEAFQLNFYSCNVKTNDIF